jgi:hypothetical protein
MKRILFAAAVAAILGAGASAQSKVDVTGKWQLNVETQAGGGTPVVTLKQDGSKLTGHYSSSNLGEAELTGSIDNTDVTFTFTANVQGTSLNVTYKGSVEKDAMKGTVSLGDLGEGTFTGKRQ